MNEVVIRDATSADISAMGQFDAQVFSGHRNDPQAATAWLEAWFQAAPYYRMWVAELDGRVVGFITWRFEGGCRRPEPVLELDRLAVEADSHNQGIGSRLIEESMARLGEWVRANNTRFTGTIRTTVWVYSDNAPANRVYRRYMPSYGGSRNQYGNPETMWWGEIVMPTTDRPY